MTDVEEEDKILGKLSSIQKRIEDGFTKMEDEMAALKQECKQDILAIRNELNELKKSTESAWVEINTLKEENESLKKQMASTLSENVRLNEDVNGPRDGVIRQEDYSRRDNLRLYNIPENQDESTEQCRAKVKEVITTLVLIRTGSVSMLSIESVNNKRTCPQRAALKVMQQRVVNRNALETPMPDTGKMDADAVWGRRKELLQSPTLSSVFIDKDLSTGSAKI